MMDITGLVLCTDGAGISTSSPAAEVKRTEAHEKSDDSESSLDVAPLRFNALNKVLPVGLEPTTY